MLVEAGTSPLVASSSRCGGAGGRGRTRAGILCQGVTLGSLESRQRQVELFERYAPLLTEQQRGVLELYLRSDWSLSEIARTRETSRSAAHDMIHRAAQ